MYNQLHKTSHRSECDIDRKMLRFCVDRNMTSIGRYRACSDTGVLMTSYQTKGNSKAVSAFPENGSEQRLRAAALAPLLVQMPRQQATGTRHISAFKASRLIKKPLCLFQRKALTASPRHHAASKHRAERARQQLLAAGAHQSRMV